MLYLALEVTGSTVFCRGRLSSNHTITRSHILINWKRTVKRLQSHQTASGWRASLIKWLCSRGVRKKKPCPRKRGKRLLITVHTSYRIKGAPSELPRSSHSRVPNMAGLPDSPSCPPQWKGKTHPCLEKWEGCPAFWGKWHWRRWVCPAFLLVHHVVNPIKEALSAESGARSKCHFSSQTAACVLVKKSGWYPAGKFLVLK